MIDINIDTQEKEQNILLIQLKKVVMENNDLQKIVVQVKNNIKEQQKQHQEEQK